jgi:hypothetical protein
MYWGLGRLHLLSVWVAAHVHASGCWLLKHTSMQLGQRAFVHFKYCMNPWLNRSRSVEFYTTCPAWKHDSTSEIVKWASCGRPHLYSQVFVYIYSLLFLSVLVEREMNLPLDAKHTEFTNSTPSLPLHMRMQCTQPTKNLTRVRTKTIKQYWKHFQSLHMIEDERSQQKF